MAASEIRGLSDGELLDLFEELWELPCADLSLQAELPKVLSPILGRLGEAIAEDEPDPDLLEVAACSIDGPIERARLARAALAQAEAGRIDGKLANAALFDLGSGSRHLLHAALLEALAIRVGAASTPAGLRLVA